MSLCFETPEEKRFFLTELLRLLKSRGVVKIQNHSIPDDDIHKLFDMTTSLQKGRYSSQLLMDNRRVYPPKANPNHGYSFIGQENAVNISGYEKGEGPGKTCDIKETLDMGSAQDDLFDDLWIPEDNLPGFRGFMESFYEKAFKTEMQLLSTLAIALNISKDHLKAPHSRVENEPHFGTITMLFHDSVGGPRVKDQTQPGIFRNVESAKPADIMLNISHSLQRLTNDTFRAGCLRITYPPGIKARVDVTIPERYSIAYFCKPSQHASLLLLKEFITEATPCRYDDVTSWEWNNRRIEKLFS